MFNVLVMWDRVTAAVWESAVQQGILTFMSVTPLDIFNSMFGAFFSRVFNKMSGQFWGEKSDIF